MIQNIEPHVYRNEYVPEPPKEDSVILYYEGRKILVKIEDQEISFLTFKEAAVYNPDVYEEYTYLFSIDGQGYYLAEGIDPENFPGFELKDNQYFREARPKYRQFAAVTGWQLYRWYQSRKFCGHCGQPMVHDDKERMMRCPDCGMMEFPAPTSTSTNIDFMLFDSVSYSVSVVANPLQPLRAATTVTDKIKIVTIFFFIFSSLLFSYHLQRELHDRLFQSPLCMGILFRQGS